MCSTGSLLAVTMSYTGLLKNSKPVVIIGQIVGVLDLLFCVLFWLLYF